jgi:hypothetical protein
VRPLLLRSKLQYLTGITRRDRRRRDENCVMSLFVRYVSACMHLSKPRLVRRCFYGDFFYLSCGLNKLVIIKNIHCLPRTAASRWSDRCFYLRLRQQGRDENKRTCTCLSETREREGGKTSKHAVSRSSVVCPPQPRRHYSRSQLPYQPPRIIQLLPEHKTISRRERTRFC